MEQYKTWKDLYVFEQGNFLVGSLIDVINHCVSYLDNVVIYNGKIKYWEYYFLSDNYNKCSENIPVVDWDGFEDYLNMVRGLNK